MPPTQISGSPWQSAWNTNTSPKLAPTASTFAVSVGDLIVVEAVEENGNTLNTPTNAAGTSPASITWTARPNLGTSGATCRTATWTGVVTVAGNVQVSVVRSTVVGTGDYGVIVWAFNSHGGVGAIASGSGGTGTATLPSATPGSAWTANSTVCCANGDWTAGSHGASRSYLTNLGAATERNYTPVTSEYTTEAWEHTDTGASPGSGAIGLSTPTMNWTLVGIEVLPPAGGAVTSVPQATTPILFPLRTFQSFGPPLIAGFEGTDLGGPTLLTDSDAGTGSETSDVQATVPGSDTSTGTDAGTVAATASDSDSGTGTDTQSALAAAVPGSDSATGTEASTGVVTAPGSDTGSGSETSSTAVTLSDSDSGTGTDVQTSLAIPITGTDAGTGSESGAVAATVPGSESSTGSESSSAAVTASGSDSGAGSDAGSVAVPVAGSDSGTGTEGSVVAATDPGGEAGAGTDAGTVSVTASGSDSGAGTDAGSVADITGGATPISDSDSGSGSETSSIVITAVDTGGGGSDFGDESLIYGEPTRRLSDADAGAAFDYGVVVDVTPPEPKPQFPKLRPRREVRRVLGAADGAAAFEREDVLAMAGSADAARAVEGSSLVDVTPEDAEEAMMVMGLLFD